MLPDLDDGPERLEEALGMARMAVADGIQSVIVTPHAARVAALGGRKVLEERVQSFSRQLENHAIALKVVMGMEYLLSLELLDEAQRSQPITLNDSHYVLVEIDFLQYPPFTDDGLFQLQLMGLTPVLAHPERQATIQERPDLLARLVERGVVSQITGGSVLGYFGKEAQRSVQHLLTHNLVHLMASDGHTATENRPPVMKSAMAAVELLVGERAAHALAVSNPRAVLADGAVALPAINPTRRRFFSGFGRQQP